MNSCVTEIDVCVIRGDTFAMDVALGNDWIEVLENPNLFRSNLIFRASQDDSSPVLLQLQAVPQLLPDAILDEPRLLLSFITAGSVTQTLPNYDIVGYCEIFEVAAPSPSRLFNMQVQISD